jgi:hypothetical protein
LRRGSLQAVLAPLVLAACGGNVEPRSEAPSTGEQPGPLDPTQPSPSDEGGEPSGGEPEGPTVSVGTPSDIDVGIPPVLPRLECPWEVRGSMPIGSSGMAAAAQGGRFYLFGGRILDEYTNAPGQFDLGVAGRWSVVQAYDPASDTWTSKQPMPLEATSLTAATVGSAIYVFFGFGTTEFARQAYRYEPATDRWLELASVPVYRKGLTSAVVGSRIYLVGGSGQEDDGPQTDGLWSSKNGLLIFDTTTNTWSEGAPAPGPILGGATCAFGGRIYAFDGYVSGATYIYDTVTNSWTEGTPAPEARNEMACVANVNKLLLLGGRVSISHEIDGVPDEPFMSRGTIESSRLIQEYEPATDTWMSNGRLPRAREQFAALPLGEAVYVIGGSESHTVEGPPGTFVLDEVSAMLPKFCEVR